MLEEYKDSLKKLLADNKIEEVIKGLIYFSKNNEEIKDEVVLINSRFSALEDGVRKGMLNLSAEDNARNQIANSLLKLINKISGSDLKIYIENSEIVLSLREKLKNFEKESSEYKEEVQTLKNEISILLQQIKMLENKDNENIRTINQLKELEKVKLVKVCKKCQGAGAYTEELSIQFIFNVTLSQAFDRKEQIIRQLKEQSEVQIQEAKIKYKLSTSELHQLSNGMATFFSAIIINIPVLYVFNRYTKTLERKIERTFFCSECEGAGLEPISRS